MNELLKRMMLQAGYMEQANDGTQGGGGGSGSDDKGGKSGDDGDTSGADDNGGESGSKDSDSGSKKGGISDNEAKLLKENMAKKEQLKKTQDELDALRKKFDGIDPEAVRKLLDEQKSAETKALEAKGDYERLKQRMAEEHSKEVDSLKKKIAELEGTAGKLFGTINDLTVGTQFSQSQFINEELTLTPAKARVIYGSYFEVEDGKIVGYDKPKGAAGRTALVDQYGTPVGFEAALRKIVEADPEKDHLIKSKIKPGAGSDSKKASGEPAKNQVVDSVSKISAGLKGLNIVA